MAKVPCHLSGNCQSALVSKPQTKVTPGKRNYGRQAGEDNEWTFQTLLSLIEDGDEQRLFECISHLEPRIREASKIFGSVHRKRTQVLSGLQRYVATHGLRLTCGQIRKYRMSKVGKQAAMVYLN